MNARIIPFPIKRTHNPKQKAPELTDLFFGNINLRKFFRSLPSRYGEDDPKNRKSKREK